MEGRTRRDESEREQSGQGVREKSERRGERQHKTAGGKGVRAMYNEEREREREREWRSEAYLIKVLLREVAVHEHIAHARMQGACRLLSMRDKASE